MKRKGSKAHASCWRFVLLLAAPLLFATFGLADDAQSSRLAVHYTVSMPRPETHMFDVEMTISGFTGDEIDLSMPIWTPGSYLVREYPRHVVTFSAEDGDGQPLEWRKVDKNTWKIKSIGEEQIVARYQVYGRERGVRWSYLNDKYANILGPNLFLYIEGRTDLPAKVTFNTPKGWYVTSGLFAESEDQYTFNAGSYHELIDSPIVIGAQKEMLFEVADTTHVMAFTGRTDADLERLRDATKKIVEECLKLFGDLPYKRFAFIVNFFPGGRGGLEHANGLTMSVQSWGFTDEKNYQRYFRLTSHEYFHAWNVKKIQPPAFKPYTYDRENYTDVLWLSEGVTVFYTDLILLRAGLMNREDYLGYLSEAINSYLRRPGRFVQSAAESSFDAWIKHYRSDENSPNTQISYYTKGQILGLVLHLEIAKRTGGKKNLDDVLRLLWERTKADGRGFESDDVRAVCGEVAGGSFKQIFDDYVFGVKEIPLAQFLDYAGCDLAADTGKSANEQLGGFLGADLEERDGKLLLGTVYTGAPAYKAGLNFDDEIIAIEGIRVSNQSELQEQLKIRKPGDEVNFLISRFGEVRTIRLELGEHPVSAYKIVVGEDPTTEQRAVRKASLGEAK